MKKLSTACRLALFAFLSLAALLSCASTDGAIYSEDGTYLYPVKIGTEYLAEDLIDSYWEYLEINDMEEDVKRLAVLPFVNENGRKTDIGRDIANSMQVGIHDPELFSLLERERIDSLLEEYKFAKTGMVDEISSAELGQLLGAELVLVGTVSQKSYTTVISKIVDLATGEVRAIGEINLKDVPEARELE